MTEKLSPPLIPSFSIRELRVDAGTTVNDLIDRGGVVLITKHGRPYASISVMDDECREIISNMSKYRQAASKAYKDGLFAFAVSNALYVEALLLDLFEDAKAEKIYDAGDAAFEAGQAGNHHPYRNQAKKLVDKLTDSYVYGDRFLPLRSLYSSFSLGVRLAQQNHGQLVLTRSGPGGFKRKNVGFFRLLSESDIAELENQQLVAAASVFKTRAS